jgi:hypothetical protein
LSIELDEFPSSLELDEIPSLLELGGFPPPPLELDEITTALLEDGSSDGSPVSSSLLEQENMNAVASMTLAINRIKRFGFITNPPIKEPFTQYKYTNNIHKMLTFFKKPLKNVIF